MLCSCWTFYLSVFTCKFTLYNFYMKEKTTLFLLMQSIFQPVNCVFHWPFYVPTLFIESSTCSILYHTASLANAHWVCFQCRRIHTKSSPVSNRFALNPTTLLFVSLEGGSQHHIGHSLEFQGKKRSFIMVFVPGIWFSERVHNHSFFNMVYQKL